MAQSGCYREELESELKHTDPESHASRLLTQEIERLKKGEDEKKDGPVIIHIDLHEDRPKKTQVKIRLPVREHPKYNFVGKLLGPKGSTLKALQEQTGCKMAIMGRGSIRDKEKEEELRKEGGKYAHLNEDLHVLVESYSEVADGYHRLASALTELKKFVVPQLQDEMYGGGDMEMNGSSYRGRGGGGGYRGGPPERGGRGGGGFRGRGSGPAPPPPGGRGAPGGRGGPPSRGAPPRGSPGGRGGPPARGGGSGGRGGGPSMSYNESGYGSQGYNSGYGSTYESGYGDNYGQSYSSGADSQYYDYGHGSSSAAGYDSYSGGYDYGNESWGTGNGKTQSQTRGGGTPRGQTRSHPYQRPSGGSGGY